MNKRALVAMSGGVDSSVAAYLALQQGYDCTGITMKFFDDVTGGINKDLKDAEYIAARLGMKHYVLDCAVLFKERVIDEFVKAYQQGITPNPCVECNRTMKMQKLLENANQMQADCMITGHYVRTEYDQASGRYLLKKAKDDSKDQSYVLYCLTQEQLSKAFFPLGMFTKHEVRDIAKEHGFVNAKKSESQDICFVPEGNYADFIESYLGKTYPPGDFVDLDGHVIGKHKGLIRYTIGQRRGLGLALPCPMYVHSKNVYENTVRLCRNEQLFGRLLEARDFNWVACERPQRMIRVKAKIRYNQMEQWANAWNIDENRVRVEFDRAQRAIAPGQSVVLYDGDVVIGGGIIVN